jgi:hypothetical protein
VRETVRESYMKRLLFDAHRTSLDSRSIRFAASFSLVMSDVDRLAMLPRLLQPTCSGS